MCDGCWPDAGAAVIELIATLLTINLNMQRPLWSRQIEKSNARTQSKVDFPSCLLVIGLRMTCSFAASPR